MPQSEPGYGAQPAALQQPLPEAYSAAPGDGGANRAARADGVAANRLEDGQALPASNKKARIDDVTKLVAEENASRSKFPRYAGLERWELIEKMGDGAFSNVYRARDLEGNAGEVAIKVVRKYEMNSMQVSLTTTLLSHLLSQHLSSTLEIDCFLSFPTCPAFRCDLCVFSRSFYQHEDPVLGPETSSSRFQAKGSESRRGAKDFTYSVLS